MENVAKLIFEGKEYDFPIVVGTEGEKAMNIEKLRALTGLITLDSGYKNTGSCKSAITRRGKRDPTLSWVQYRGSRSQGGVPGGSLSAYLRRTSYCGAVR